MSSDDDVIVATHWPEADAEQQSALDPDWVGATDEGADPADLDRAAEADLLEQRQTVVEEEEYPHGAAD